MLLSGVIAGAETAIVALRGSRVRELVQSGIGGARAVKRLRENPERLLATVQIHATLLSVAAGVVGGSALGPRLEEVAARVSWLAPAARPLSFLVAALAVAYASIVFGELIPKSLALRYAEPYALAVSRLVAALAWLSRPCIWVLTASSNLVLRLFGDSTTFSEARISPEELQKLVNDAAKAGSVDPRAGEIASRAIAFAELCASHVMVPRSGVVGISRSATPDDLQRIILEDGHTRMPIYEGTIDKVIGYVTVRDLMAVFWEKDLILLEDVLRPAYFVPKTMRAVELLAEMKRRRIQLAIVVDETETMCGIVTLEDLVEELVGDIFSEHDDVPPERIRREGEGTWVVMGEATVRDVNRELGIGLPEGETWSTVAGLCLELAGRIPETGERLTSPDGCRISILEATPRHIRSIRVRRPRETVD